MIDKGNANGQGSQSESDEGTCHICSITGFDEYKLSDNLTIEQSLKCNQCEAVFEQETMLTQHIREDHLLQCQSCGIF